MKYLPRTPAETGKNLGCDSFKYVARQLHIELLTLIHWVSVLFYGYKGKTISNKLLDGTGVGVREIKTEWW